MKRRSFLKALGAGSVVLGANTALSANSVMAENQKAQSLENSKILVDKISKSYTKGDLIEVDFLDSYAKSSKILSASLKENKEVFGVLSNANFVLISEFLPENSKLRKSSVDNNLVYFSLKGNKNV